MTRTGGAPHTRCLSPSARYLCYATADMLYDTSRPHKNEAVFSPGQLQHALNTLV